MLQISLTSSIKATICSLFVRMYETSLTDAHWALIAPFIPPPKTGGRPRTTDARAVVDAVLYLLKTGCQWRQLPKDFPPWQTVYRFFTTWRRKGVWRKLHYHLYEKVRVTIQKRHPQPSLLVIDSQSVKTGKNASIKSRGYDGGKKVKGRKRHMVVDTEGLLVDVSVTPANMHDTKGGQKALLKVAKRRKFVKRVKRILGDKGYQGSPFSDWVRKKLGAVVETSENLAQKVKKFVPAKTRWVVERSHAWVGDYWRLTTDRERNVVNSMTFTRIAFIRVMLRRLHV